MATIGMVLENDYPPDIRVAKEADALRAAGDDGALRVALLMPDGSSDVGGGAA